MFYTGEKETERKMSRTRENILAHVFSGSSGLKLESSFESVKVWISSVIEGNVAYQA